MKTKDFLLINANIYTMENEGGEKYKGGMSVKTVK